MKLVKKGVACKTIGDLKKAIERIPDRTRFTTMGDEGAYLVEQWKLEKEFDGFSYENEKDEAEYEGRKPDFLRVRIEEDEDESGD
jgi:hypothetical protein